MNSGLVFWFSITQPWNPSNTLATFTTSRSGNPGVSSRPIAIATTMTPAQISRLRHGFGGRWIDDADPLGDRLGLELRRGLPDTDDHQPSSSSIAVSTAVRSTTPIVTSPSVTRSGRSEFTTSGSSSCTTVSGEMSLA